MVHSGALRQMSCALLGILPAVLTRGRKEDEHNLECPVNNPVVFKRS